MKRLHLIALPLLLILFHCEKNLITSHFTSYTWPTAAPADQGMRADRLDSAILRAQTHGFIDGLLVIRNGFIVAERYFNGYDASKAHDIKSVSKSFLSALTGLAFHHGYLDSLDEKVLEYFPEYVTADMDARKHQITIRHLLTMRMGIDDESNNFGDLYASPNWIKGTLELPLVNDPGQRMLYNTFQTHLLSAILTKASGMDTKKLAQKHLTDPMGITIDYWQQDPQGYYWGGAGMHFTPREMAVLGKLYLNAGRLDGAQIVPQEWVEFTLRPSTHFQPNSWGSWENYNYAYLWWLGQMNSNNMFLAYGWGGQFIACFPDLNLIIITTANGQVNLDTATVQEWAIFDIMTQYIIPAIDENV
ncbi:serine hydrolase [candidate division KSB1 bacterium]|nr:serine hydrolase [candidate division KSB1 bacterium]